MDPTKLTIQIPMVIEGINLMVIHGACCLALRHPEYKGASRPLLIRFVNDAEKILKDIGALDEADIKLIHNTERQESPHKNYWPTKDF